MPFFIPAISIGAGVTLIVWGSKMFLDNNDSADEKAAEILARIPAEFAQYIDEISTDSTGIHISFRFGTPLRVRRAVRNNIESE